jgi:hypothetical protein
MFHNLYKYLTATTASNAPQSNAPEPGSGTPLAGVTYVTSSTTNDPPARSPVMVTLEIPPAKLTWRSSFLGGHPKPASRDHPKTGQLQTRIQDKIVVPYLKSSGKLFLIPWSRMRRRFWSASSAGHTSIRVHDGGDDQAWRSRRRHRQAVSPNLRRDDLTLTGCWCVRSDA